MVKTTWCSPNRAPEWRREVVSVILYVEGLLVSDGLDWITQKQLIYWDLSAQPRLKFTRTTIWKKLNKNQSNVFKYKHLIRIQTAECKMGSCKSFGRKCLMVIKSSHELPDSKHVNVTEYSLDFQNKITSILTDASGLMFTAAGSNWLTLMKQIWTITSLGLFIWWSNMMFLVVHSSWILNSNLKRSNCW